MAEITIYTLAKELNMSPSMVSRAFNPDGKINEEKRQIVLKAAEKYNFMPNKFASRLSMRTIKIGILINCRFEVNTDKMLDGIKRAYERLKDYKIEYDITVVNPIEDKNFDYKKALEKFARYDGIIITGMGAEKYTDLINELYNKNPNIVQAQAINESAKYLFASKHNEKTAAEMAAEFLYNCLRKSERKNIVLFTGDRLSPLHKSAEEAFKTACENLSLTILESFDMNDSNECLKKIVPDIFEKYGEKIDGIYITSGVSTALCEYIEENRYDIPLVTFDTHNEIKMYMEKGVVSATIAQNVGKQLENAFSILARYIISEEQVPKTVYTNVQLVLKSNMHLFD